MDESMRLTVALYEDPDAGWRWAVHDDDDELVSGWASPTRQEAVSALLACVTDYADGDRRQVPSNTNGGVPKVSGNDPAAYRIG